ncbi:MAG: hypothetical protein Unbinned400contig1004_46 [Prokaryotic dsDNA virus sp.]|nr:MAG: hypothetical protein Unbinned400contig1004_46 [Prokaryotic dsDNA virus sp.]|tara:strand:+ start:693 stop:986 length:294 start_codon:yes stop_codon:yes gene_type:complete
MGRHKINLTDVTLKLEQKYSPKSIVRGDTETGRSYINLIKQKNYRTLTNFGSLNSTEFIIEQLEKSKKPYVVELKPSTVSKYIRIWTRFPDSYGRNV